MFYLYCCCVLVMRLHPRYPLDLLDQPTAISSDCTITDNCDNLAVDDRITVESDDIAV